MGCLGGKASIWGDVTAPCLNVATYLIKHEFEKFFGFNF